jgi:hypothetical protein
MREMREMRPDDDKLEAVATNLRNALVAALKVIAWPHSPEVSEWRDDSYMSRLAAARLAEGIEHPRRLSGIHVDVLYASALRRLHQEHRNARALDPKSPEASPPQSLPPACHATLRQLLDPSGDLAVLLTLG